MNHEILELLYRSFDERLTEEERKRLDQALAASDELRAERERIAAMREAISSTAASSFGPLFAERVMDRIREGDEPEAALEPFFDSLWRFFKPLAGVAAAAVITIMTLNLRDSGALSLSAAFAVHRESIDSLLETPLESILEEPL